MSDQYQFEFLAWCQEGGADKVWGFIRLRDDDEYLYNFWGKRGKKLTWKRYEFDAYNIYDFAKRQYIRCHHTHCRELEAKARQKLSKGYTMVDLTAIEAATPGFTDEFESQFVIAKLFEKYHGEDAS